MNIFENIYPLKELQYFFPLLMPWFRPFHLKPRRTLSPLIIVGPYGTIKGTDLRNINFGRTNERKLRIFFDFWRRATHRRQKSKKML